MEAGPLVSESLLESKYLYTLHEFSIHTQHIQSKIINLQSSIINHQSTFPPMPSTLDPTQCCKICNKPVPPSTRYPNRVCEECTTHTTDITGRPVCFENSDSDGGLVGVYTDTNESYPLKVCYISGILCKVEEVRFGGVAIEVVNTNKTTNSI